MSIDQDKRLIVNFDVVEVRDCSVEDSLHKIVSYYQQEASEIRNSVLASPSKQEARRNYEEEFLKLLNSRR